MPADLVCRSSMCMAAALADNVLIKLDATNRAAAVAEAMRRGVIPGIAAADTDR